MVKNAEEMAFTWPTNAKYACTPHIAKNSIMDYMCIKIKLQTTQAQNCFTLVLALLNYYLLKLLILHDHIIYLTGHVLFTTSSSR